MAGGDTITYYGIENFPFSDANKALVWVGRFCGLLSVIGSSLIIYDVVIKSRKTAYNRRGQKTKTPMSNYILFLMSIADILASTSVFILGPVMVPQGQAYQAVGNTATCTAQGFVNWAAICCGILYNTVMAMYYLLFLKFQWTEETFHTAGGKFFFLAFPVLLGVGFSIWPLVDGAFNFIGTSFCSVLGYPFGCDWTPDMECERGSNSGAVFQSYFFSLISCFVIITVCMALIWLYVVKIEKASNRYEYGDTQRQSRKIAIVGTLYSLCFLLTYFAQLIIYVYLFKGMEDPFWAYVLYTIFLPLQGFMNAFVYFYRQDKDNLVYRTMSNIRSSLKFSSDLKLSKKTASSSATNVTTEGGSSSTPSHNVEEGTTKTGEENPKAVMMVEDPTTACASSSMSMGVIQE